MKSCQHFPGCSPRSTIFKRRGFTIAELLVQIGILSVLSSLVPAIQPIFLRDVYARQHARSDLEELCEAVSDYIHDIDNPIPEDLASIIDELPDRFELIEEEDGSSVDVAANGFRYELFIHRRYTHERSRFQNDPRYRSLVDFVICATPSSPELINSEFCVEYFSRYDDCLVREFPLDEGFDPLAKQRFLQRLGFQFTESAMQDGHSAEETAGFIRFIDYGAVQDTLEQVVDANGDNQITLKEIKDLEDSPVVGGFVKTWSDTYAIGKYGEQIDQISAPIEAFDFREAPAEFLTQYYDLRGQLSQEPASGAKRSIAASAAAAQRAANKGNLAREQRQREIIRRKGLRAWLRGRLSNESIELLDYSLNVRQAYLEDEPD